MNGQEIIGIRYFEKKKYARDFIKGRIFFNSAGTFENIKNDEQNYNEGQIPFYSDKIKFGDKIINGDVKITFYYEEYKRVPICCFSYITLKDLDNGEYISDEKLKRVYKYFVVFNIGDLLESLSKVLCNNGCGICARPVEYFDFNDKTNPWLKLDLSDIPVDYRKFFIHSDKHKHQKEFRIVITHKLFNYEGANTKINISKNWSKVKLKVGKLKQQI